MLSAAANVPLAAAAAVVAAATVARPEIQWAAPTAVLAGARWLGLGPQRAVLWRATLPWPQNIILAAGLAAAEAPLLTAAAMPRQGVPVDFQLAAVVAAAAQMLRHSLAARAARAAPAL
jgi:hypothetical protein